MLAQAQWLSLQARLCWMQSQPSLYNFLNRLLLSAQQQSHGMLVYQSPLLKSLALDHLERPDAWNLDTLSIGFSSQVLESKLRLSTSSYLPLPQSTQHISWPSRWRSSHGTQGISWFRIKTHWLIRICPWLWQPLSQLFCLLPAINTRDMSHRIQWHSL